MTKDIMVAACDPQKLRPLAIGCLENGYVVASETCVFDIIGAEYVREIEPGEIVTFSEEGVESAFFIEPEKRHLSHCIFEMIYFARPDSNVFGENVHTFRSKLGRKMSEEHPVASDMVISIPDSGNSAAIGFAEKAGIPFQRGFIRNHYVGRTFIQPQQEERDISVKMKLNVIKEQVKGKKIIVVDDSLIRGTTSKSRLECLRQAGAEEIHMRISAPPCKHPCYYGIDFPSGKELIASNKTLDEICQRIGADSLQYISIEGMLSCTKNPEHWCTACFSGEYPVEVTDKEVMDDKYSMDSGFEEN